MSPRSKISRAIPEATARAKDCAPYVVAASAPGSVESHITNNERVVKMLLMSGYGMITGALATIALRRRKTLFTRPLLMHAATMVLHAIEVGTRRGFAVPDAGFARAARFTSATATCATGVLLVASVGEMLAFPSAAADALTLLPNRFFFMSTLEKTVRRMRGRHAKLPAAVIFVDLNHFKAVNDRHGHEAGDKVLVEVGNRLRALVPAPNVAARIGGDEFAVLVREVRSPEHLDKLVARIAESFSLPFLGTEFAVPVGASLGFALVDGRLDVPGVMRAADEAMYTHKRELSDRRH